jgi:glycosyltransferase involved in cell wall biosynthesis
MSGPIRVLQLLVTMTVGGGPKHVYDLVRRLPRDEFEVTVAGPRDGIFFERFRQLGVPVVELPLRELGLRPILSTVRLLRRHRIQVVHTHGKGAGLYGRLAARWAGVPAVHTFHGIHYSGYWLPARALYLALERRLSSLSYSVINVSASQCAEGLNLRLFEPSRNITVVNGIDVGALDESMAHSAIQRASLGLTAEDVVIGCVTRFDPIKKVETLLRTVERLAASIPRLTLLLVGGGGEEERLRRLVADRGLGRRVIFTGLLEDSARVYPILDLYVASSLREGLPLALLEAMGAGLAIVATDVSGHRDVVRHAETGLLVPPEDESALAEAIASLLADPDRRRQMGAAGRRRVVDEFSIGPMVERMAGIYRHASTDSASAPTSQGPTLGAAPSGAAAIGTSSMMMAAAVASTAANAMSAWWRSLLG